MTEAGTIICCPTCNAKLMITRVAICPEDVIVMTQFRFLSTYCLTASGYGLCAGCTIGVGTPRSWWPQISTCSLSKALYETTT